MQGKCPHGRPSDDSCPNCVLDATEQMAVDEDVQRKREKAATETKSIEDMIDTRMQRAKYVIMLEFPAFMGAKEHERRRVYYWEEDDQGRLKAYVAGLLKSAFDSGEMPQRLVIHRLDGLAYMGKIESHDDQAFVSTRLNPKD